MRSQAACRFGWAGLLVTAALVGCGGDNATNPGGMGTIEIRTATTGVDMDADGYAIQVDGGTSQPIGVSATVQSADVVAGDHSVQLTGLAANCSLAGQNPQTVSVAANESATVNFAITCSATTGGLQVSATTSGPATDADGYSLTVDGADRGTIGASGAVTVDGLTAGPHEIGLSGLSANCRVQGDNPQSITVTGGGSATVAFTVTCDAPPPVVGTLRIATVTTGPSPDPNGYRFLIDGGAAQTIGVNAGTTLSNVAAGSHSVRLTGLAPNCKVQGTNPRSASVTSGSTAEVSFAIECAAATGSVQVSTTTTGDNPDADGYTVSVDGGAAQAIGPNATVTLPAIPTGSRRVLLEGLASNCAIPGENPQRVTVIINSTASLQFAVTCSGPTGGGPSWTRMNSGTTLTLEAVSGSSAANVFAAGETNGQMTIVHYDGTGWTGQFTQAGGVADVWAASATDAFALVTGAAFPGPVQRYNGQQWAPMNPQPPAPGEDPAEEPGLAAIWGASSSDVFAVGELFVNVGLSHQYIIHYNGTQWSQMPMTGGEWISLTDVWGSSPTDVYAVGVYNRHDADPSEFRSVILHYDGQAWTEVFRAPNPNLTLRKIWGLSRSDVYAVGDEAERAAILHFDGQAWTAMPSPVTLQATAIWGSAPNDLYALPGPNRPTERPGVIWHWDGTNWTAEPTGVEDGLLDIWGSSASDIFVVGGNGTILHGP